MLIRELKWTYAEFGKDCFLAENAVIVGDVVMEISVASGTML